MFSMIYSVCKIVVLVTIWILGIQIRDLDLLMPGIQVSYAASIIIAYSFFFNQ